MKPSGGLLMPAGLRPDPIRQILGQGVQPFGAQQVGEILVGQQLAQCADDEQQVALLRFRPS
jgi:hypothetical protein